MKYKIIKSLTGFAPGAHHIEKKDINNFKKIFKLQAPYRFAGKNKEPFCSIVEKKFKKFLNREKFLLVSSGTAALHCAIESIEVKKNDEIIIPAFGWSADLMAVIASKAIPVILPIDSYFGLDTKILESKINKKTKAIIAIHMRGNVVDIKKICSIGKKHNIKIIEDCSQCFGGSYNKKPVGSLGDISTFSFQYNKLLTSGEGGAVATNNLKLYRKINEFHDLGMGRVFGQPDPIKKVANKMGLNYHFNELSAALLLTQFEKKNKILKNLKINTDKLKKLLLLDIKKFDLEFSLNRPYTKSNNTFLIFKGNSEKSIKKFIKFLDSKNIQSIHNGQEDGHNFNSWIRFLKKNKIVFKNYVNIESNKLLNNSCFIEVNSLL